MPPGRIRRLKRERRKMMAAARMTNDSNATTNGTTAMTVKDEPMGGPEALPPQLGTTDGSTGGTNALAVLNQSVGDKEALAPAMVDATDGSTATNGRKHKGKKKKKKKTTSTRTDSTTAATIMNQPVGSKVALALSTVGATDGSATLHGEMQNEEEDIVEITYLQDMNTKTTVKNQPLGVQEALVPRWTMTNGSTVTTGMKPKRKKKKKTATKLPRSWQEHKIKGGKKLIIVKLRKDIFSCKPGDPLITGRLSEAAVHQYLSELLGPRNVEWMNKYRESGLPYDIVITRGGVTEYVEVKAGMAPDEQAFHIIQPSEWQFLSEKRGYSSIAHVSFLAPDVAAIVMLRNPHKLCQKKDLGLALVMSKEFEEHFAKRTNQISVVLNTGFEL
ncbi:hypothetical protein SEVIR_2G195200v4 [Setaria viridis]|uniref:Protein NO VEIN C-terminal domain-containing protein n=1 Tax=Setaria viridis TaxID=4556 RepID=A0A4V6DBD9_SETVI|nr:uncharacterized protein LOC117846248 [Setaria viridis]TKW32866.1 hypothetical protein SEVIR_2G195200v2 [Setaria viridis]